MYPIISQYWVDVVYNLIRPLLLPAVPDPVALPRINVLTPADDVVPSLVRYARPLFTKRSFTPADVLLPPNEIAYDVSDDGFCNV